jgi:acetaldehyde dehydrogenase
MRVPCTIVGSGNIGTDLMYKLQRSPWLEVRLVAGVDPASDGLRRARELAIETSVDGADAVLARPEQFPVVFEATSAWVNLITCGGQATVPIVAAVARVTRVPYAEIVSTVASKSAGPGTRQNIDEFTRTTSSSLVEVGGAERGKAIMILNPAQPPILMRNTVYCALEEGYDGDAVTRSIADMVAEVSSYVPGYRLTADPVFEEDAYSTPGGAVPARVVALLEVEGAGDYFPPYAGNLDIMTASAVRVGEALAKAREGVPA